MINLNQLSESLQKGDAQQVKELVQQGLDQNMEAKDILDKGLLKGMNVIGEKFKNNEVYVPEVLIAARAMHAGLDILSPVLVSKGVKNMGRIVIGTVQGDLHDIGKNLVSIMFKGAGFEVIDLGTDISKEQFIEKVREHHPRILGMSALLTTTMVNMKGVIDDLEKANLRSQVKVMIGGAPLSQQYADEIGADVYAPDASSAADEAKKLVG